MKVINLTSPNGDIVSNQFSITQGNARYFQSYKSIIVKQTCLGKVFDGVPLKTELDQKYWNYSKTISKYRNIFLGESTKETQAKIDSGEYILTNLN